MHFDRSCFCRGFALQRLNGKLLLRSASIRASRAVS
jgi:hypothetical protein